MSAERIWIGPDYGTLRVLVLGESWYGDYDGDLATDAGYIAAYLDSKQVDRMYSKIANATGLGKQKFWRAVAFTNFVQRIGATPDCRPTRRHYQDARERLQLLLRELKPWGVWILGIEQSTYSAPVVSGAGIQCEVSPHPTSVGLPSARLAEGWNDLVARLHARGR